MAGPAYSLYILQCADGSLYTGIATDVAKRLEEHTTGPRGAKYLRGRGPLQLVFSCVAGNRAQASQLEYRVKQLPRAHKLELIDGRRKLGELLENKVDPLPELFDTALRLDGALEIVDHLQEIA